MKNLKLLTPFSGAASSAMASATSSDHAVTAMWNE
jgi:hypothetical protein